MHLIQTLSSSPATYAPYLVLKAGSPTSSSQRNFKMDLGSCKAKFNLHAAFWEIRTFFGGGDGILSLNKTWFGQILHCNSTHRTGRSTLKHLLTRVSNTWLLWVSCCVKCIIRTWTHWTLKYFEMLAQYIWRHNVYLLFVCVYYRGREIISKK